MLGSPENFAGKKIRKWEGSAKTRKEEEKKKRRRRNVLRENFRAATVTGCYSTRPLSNQASTGTSRYRTGLLQDQAATVTG